jgi:hypothetical protein
VAAEACAADCANENTPNSGTRDVNLKDLPGAETHQPMTLMTDPSVKYV